MSETNETYLQRLFVDEAKAVLFKGSVAGGSVSDDDIATDESVDGIIDGVFGDGSSGETDDNTGDETVPDDDVATDDEVGDVIDDVFG